MRLNSLTGNPEQRLAQGSSSVLQKLELSYFIAYPFKLNLNPSSKSS
jgi:hypothetical protein